MQRTPCCCRQPTSSARQAPVPPAAVPPWMRPTAAAPAPVPPAVAAAPARASVHARARAGAARAVAGRRGRWRRRRWRGWQAVPLAPYNTCCVLGSGGFTAAHHLHHSWPACMQRGGVCVRACECPLPHLIRRCELLDRRRNRRTLLAPLHGRTKLLNSCTTKVRTGQLRQRVCAVKRRCARCVRFCHATEFSLGMWWHVLTSSPLWVKPLCSPSFLQRSACGRSEHVIGAPAGRWRHCHGSARAVARSVGACRRSSIVRAPHTRLPARPSTQRSRAPRRTRRRGCVGGGAAG